MKKNFTVTDNKLNKVVFVKKIII